MEEKVWRGRMKRCSICKYDKELIEFHKDKTHKDGLKSYCKLCEKNFGDSYRKEHKDEIKKRQDSWAYKNKKKRETYRIKYCYGLSNDQYQNMFNVQNGVCAICGKGETRIRNEKVCQLTVDHDHQTGRVRGLLCSKCNGAIGWLGDDPNIVLKAFNYLQQEAR